MGSVQTGVDQEVVRAGLAAHGPAGTQAAALDRWVERELVGIGSLSDLTAHLALSYLERIRHALGALTLESGVATTARGYVAHLGVEADPSAYGAGSEIPVLGTLPDLRRGRPPQDLLSRVVKATRRNFEAIRAVPSEVWDGYVLCVVGRAHADGAAGNDGTVRFLDPGVVDSLVRFGWVLRQVDLRYGQEPGQA